MMWFLLLLLHIAHVELVISQAVDKLILRNTGGNPCKGHLEVYRKTAWGYVGDAHWSENTEKVVCKSTHCGEPVANSTKNILKPSEHSTIWLNELKCEGTESSLWDCDGPGWNSSSYLFRTVKKLHCSSKINISLDGECAGAVQYSDGKTSGYFCNNVWEQKAANLVCKSLGCGGVREIPNPERMDSERFRNSKTKMKLDCSAFQKGGPDHLWHCAAGKHVGDSASCRPAPVICENYRRLQLKGNQSNVCSGQLEEEQNGKWVPVRHNDFSFDVCQQMHCGKSLSPDNKTNSSLHVKCADEVKVVLMDSGKESKCYGTVNIRVNGSEPKPVCASSWTNKEAEIVCKELKCGKLIYFSGEARNSKAVMDYVKCNGSESSLWHCQAQHGKHIQCQSQPKVVCSESVKVELVDGPGRCAGRLAIEHEGQWKSVTNKAWTDTQSQTVCKELNCGEKGKTEKFSQGSSRFLSINCENKKISNISECLKADSNTTSLDQEAVGITCADHKVVFLKGTEACSGHVGIQHGDKTYWLSGSNATWNQMSADTVCQQMHCGNATNISSTSTPDMNRSVWNEFLSCSSSQKSLFQCNKNTSLPPDHRNSTAYVKCSGKIEMKLMNGCWGKVKVYAEGKHGDTCADTWTEEMSVRLCKNLGCGTALKAQTHPPDGDILVKSLHATSQNTKMTQWNFVINQDNDKSCKQRPAYVVCSGSVKPRFSSSSEHCSGNIEVEYEGLWIPVCSDALTDKNAQNTICQQLKCGDAVKRLSYFGPTPAGKPAISSLRCSAGANSSLSACNITTSQSVCKHSGLQCADWKAMVPVGNKACSGSVLVYSRKETSAVSSIGWTETGKGRLCQDMNCGKYQSIRKTQDQAIEINSFWNKSFSCANSTSKSIWECEKETPPSEKNVLFIECQGEPIVSLSQHCRGEVRINGTPVCARNWDLSYAHKVCQEQDCGNAIDVTVTSEKQPQSSPDTYHVSCEQYHSILGQCKRTKGKCDKSVVSITCSGGVKFRSNKIYEGELEVNYRDEWEKVCQNRSFSSKMNDWLCEEIRKENYSVSNKNKKVKLETTLECAEGVKDIRRCVKQSSCGNLPPAKITCGEKPTTPPPTTQPPPPSTPVIIVGVALLLLVVILIVLFIQFFVRRARRSKVSLRMLPTNDMEFESGEYEDVMNKENEMEDFSRGRFRSEDEFITENDGQSVSSLPYDDIDEADEARPLTFPGTTAPADRDVNIHEDGVTYEVEEPQESYDDIDTLHETTQTKVEVHDSPQTTHDLNTAAPPGLVQKDEDYLEPDQDG